MKKIVALVLVSSIVLTGCGTSKTVSNSSSESTGSVNSSSVEKVVVSSSSTESEKDNAESVISSSSNSEKPERNGYDEGTTNYTCKWISANIPNYFKVTSNDDSGIAFESSSETDSAVRFALASFELSQTLTTDNVKDLSAEAVSSVLSSLNLSTDDVTDVQYPTPSGYASVQFDAVGYFSDSSYPNTKQMNVKSTIIFKENESTCIGLILLVGNNSRYSYESDYNSILDHLVLVSSDSSSSTSSSSSSSVDSSQVTPELKEFLDSYEAFIDQYVEFMKEYQANPTDMTLLQQYSDYMDKLADFEKKANAYQSEEGQMSTADYNYYIDVTTRCSKKMLQASSDLSQ